MNLTFNIIPSTSVALKPSTFSCFHPRPVRTTTTAAASRIPVIPARDRVIDLGKYKGQMLGSLPSTYLKWVSKNLRAGDTEEWAKLADEVLTDPVYRDRIEWELAEKVLSGNAAAASASSTVDGSSAVKELLEISERFGWDNEDKAGWSRVNFGLLGTSKGGRIPRAVVAESSNGGVGRMKKKEKTEAEGENDEGRRRERRERVRRRKVDEGGSRKVVMGYENREEVMIKDEQQRREDSDSGAAATVGSPFPGRESLLKKVLNRQKIVW